MYNDRLASAVDCVVINYYQPNKSSTLPHRIRITISSDLFLQNLNADLFCLVKKASLLKCIHQSSLNTASAIVVF